MSVNKVSF